MRRVRGNLLMDKSESGFHISDFVDKEKVSAFWQILQIHTSQDKQALGQFLYFIIIPCIMTVKTFYSTASTCVVQKKTTFWEL